MFIYPLLVALLVWGCIAKKDEFQTLAEGGQTHLLKDPQFNKGFRANNHFYCKQWTGPAHFELGDCIEYKVVPHLDIEEQKVDGISVRTIPDDGLGDKNKFWDSIEGQHKGTKCQPPTFQDCEPHAYPLRNGGSLKENKQLHARHVSLNHQVVENSDHRLKAVSNGINGPCRSLETDRNGWIRMQFDTSKEFLNIANTYGAEFRFNTWPTFLLNQHFKELVDISKYRSIVVSMQIKLNDIRELHGNKAAYFQSKASQNASLHSYIYLREKPGIASKNGQRVSDGWGSAFVGIRIFHEWSNGDPLPGDNLSSDQFGTLFLNKAFDEKFGTPIKEGEGFTRISYDFMELLQSVLDSDTSGLLLPNATDYQLAEFNVGWEIIGHFSVDYEIKDLAITAR